MSGPRVSVLMIARDAASTLPRALASVAIQSLRDWECVLVDDASSDGTAGLAARLLPGGVRVHALERHGGRGAARAAGLERCRGELVAFLDSDDWMYADRLERSAAALERTPEAIAVFAPAIVERGARVLGVLDPSDGRWPPWPFASCVVRRGEAVRAGFSPELRHAEDLDFLLRLVEDRRWLTLPGAAYAYRVGEPDVARHRATQREVARVLVRRGDAGGLRARVGASSALARWALLGALPERTSRRLLAASRRRNLRAARPREVSRHRAERERLADFIAREGWPSAGAG
ncbi:MAG: glycosyltransferase [Polyangiaceae bacterium]|nr:glycosyltransferase [Polyangiaceae bacterium]